MTYSASEISEITGAEVFGDPDAVISSIAIDSRTIFSTENTAFLAITTEKNSGEKFIAAAIEKGIQTIISENTPAENYKFQTWLHTGNALDFLRKLAKHHFAHLPQRKTIGITGSNGKTIVKEWLYQCLHGDFSVVKSPKSYNSKLGLPLSLLQATKEHEIGIFEVGISQPGEMSQQAEIFAPQIGIFTHLGTAHLAYFDSAEQLLQEKAKIFAKSAVIIFNGDDAGVHDFFCQQYPDRELISFGFDKRNDVHIADGWETQELVSVQYFDEELKIPIRHRNAVTLLNVLPVIILLKKWGDNNARIIEKINQLRAVEMRLEAVNGVRNNLLLNDSFNLDVDSLQIAFQALNEYHKDHNILVITDFAEGKRDQAFYEKIIRLINQQNFDKVFLIGTEITNYSTLLKAETHTYDSTKDLIDSQIFNSIENSLILLKGARKFTIEEVKSHLEDQKHETVLEVNLNAVIHNINVHKNLLKPSTKMMAMVKAHAYGMGGFEIAEILQHYHIDYLGVAYADEGVQLRKRGITVPIMIMNPEMHSYSSIIEYNLEPEIYSLRVLKLFNDTLINKGFSGKYPIHIKLDTGMHRLGFQEGDIDELIHFLNSMDVEVKSVFSHLASSDMPDQNEFTSTQFKNFECISQKIIDQLPNEPLRHILNSSGIANFPDFQYDMVRIGIGLAGISSNPKIQRQLQPSVSFKTVISQILDIKKGETVGYGRAYTAPEDLRIATLPVGYADGIPRIAGDHMQVNIRGKYFPVAGRICMDMLMLNIGNENFAEGESVTIFNSISTLQAFADACQTIPYEVLTSISQRVKRIYIKD